ncbi:twin-arginine translocase TatA/TatE family subunit [Natronorarus salvus]|uniref:twin-arginine translocase TatA/TatE family subunit n=1 Tax=Natronorarus salvus TaxID=3117733 RepID=UPI002F268714
MTIEPLPLFPGFPGGIELAVIVLIAILLFGANKIPKLARSTGQAMGEFQKGREEVEQELAEMRDGATGAIEGDDDFGEPETDDTEAEPEIGTEEQVEAEPETETETST